MMLPSNSASFKVLELFCHTVPALISDALLLLQRRRARMMSSYRKVGRAIDTFV
jgi:hypothetical protein